MSAQVLPEILNRRNRFLIGVTEALRFDLVLTRCYSMSCK